MMELNVILSNFYEKNHFSHFICDARDLFSALVYSFGRGALISVRIKDTVKPFLFSFLC
jgi:hypothetical protein